MNKFSTLLTTAVLTSVFFASPVIVAEVQAEEVKEQTKKSGELKSKRAKKMKRHFKKMAKHLQLTNEQRTQIKALFKQAKSERKANKENLTGFKEQVKSLMSASSFDEKAFTDLRGQYQHHFAQMALIKVKAKHAMLQLLTDEQKEKLQNFKGREMGLFH